MATVSVHGLDDDVVRRLRERAAANNRSLEAEVRSILERAAGDDREAYRAKKKAFLERSKQLRALTAGRKHTPSEQLIREARDSDHGRLWPLD